MLGADKFQARKSLLGDLFDGKARSQRAQLLEQQHMPRRRETQQRGAHGDGNGDGNMERPSLIGASGHTGQNMPAEHEEGPFSLDKGSISLAAPGGRWDDKDPRRSSIL